jgi:hypothetical protein
MGDSVNIGGPTVSGPNQLGTTWAAIRAPAYKNDGTLNWNQRFPSITDNENWGFGQPPEEPGNFLGRFPSYGNEPKYISSSGYPEGLDFLLRAKPFSRPGHNGETASTCIGVNYQGNESGSFECYLTFGASGPVFTGEYIWVEWYYDEVNEQWIYQQFYLQTIVGKNDLRGYDWPSVSETLIGRTVSLTINGEPYDVVIDEDAFDPTKTGTYIATVDSIPLDGTKFWEILEVSSG